MRRRFLGERFLPTILILWICVNFGINSGFAETEGKYRVELVVMPWVRPNEEMTVQITTFLDKYKPPEPGQPPPPLSPEDWVYIGNVTVRFEVRDEAGNTVDLNIPQGLRTNDNGTLEITFNAPSREGKYTITAYTVIEGVECSDSHEVMVSTEEQVAPTPVPTPTPQPITNLFGTQLFYIAVVIMLSIVAVVAAVLAIRQKRMMKRKFLVASAVIVMIVAGAIGATYFLITSPTPTSTPTTPTGLPTTSPYLAEFRSHPELFMSHTRTLHILFEDESGSRIANLTGVQEVKRDGSTVNLTIHYSLVCDPSIENLTVDSCMLWLITEGPYPVPIPTPNTINLTLRNGEIKIFYNGLDEFGEKWEYALLTVVSDIKGFEIQFSKGGKWTSEEKYYYFNIVEDLFECLYLNKTEVETETIQIKTV